ncbi:MAG TPA: PIN domain-containing protein [Pyrinomonadaceae bacterium]|jgi:predicted nucleic acid-binding protein|nr:PIN domain-containing protein [Pyrinomonadaceae bacterium]
MRFLLDTDVVLDFVLEREPFVGDARALFELIAAGAHEGYVSVITPVNVFYIGRKARGDVATKQAIRDLLDAVRVCPVDQNVLNIALASPIADYEDAVQHASAAAIRLEAIVTRNVGDYRNAALPIFTPADLLNHLKRPQS